MNKSIMINSYRISAAVVVFLPIALNMIFTSNIITSFIYVPILSLVVACIAKVLDTKLMETTQLNYATSKPPLEQCIKCDVEMLPIKCCLKHEILDRAA